jgi:hypothetical protein
VQLENKVKLINGLQRKRKKEIEEESNNYAI